MINSFHIVFGAFAKQKLQQSKELNIPEEYIIDFNDDFRVGPIQNLKTQAGIDNRKDWFLSNNKTDYLPDLGSQDKEKIEFLINLPSSKSFYIWCGNDAFEILAMAKVLNEIKDFKRNIFSVDFSELELERKDGTFYKVDSIGVALTEHLCVIADHFQPLSETKQQALIRLWEGVVSENTVLRVLNKEGNIESVREDYFDIEILNQCQQETFQNAARVIGRILVAINFNAHDSTLNWRLKKLVQSQILISEGELQDIKDYKVKLNSNSLHK